MKVHTSLSLLSPVMRAMTLEFIAKLVERGVYFKIVETWRTEERHADLIASGRSWTTKSKHLLIRETDCDSEAPAAEAIDLAPWAIYDLHGTDKLMWDANDPVWEQMGVVGETVGFKWGGRWGVKDMGHWELHDG
jgi:peptidoglycan L-alanyl-D-glutamate endopeptidase CwlK